MLDIWKEQEHGGIATRDDLVADLLKNQKAESCSSLILALNQTKRK